MPGFEPLFRNPHLQTIAAHYWRRPGTNGRPVERLLVETEPGIQVLVESQQPAIDAAAAHAGELVMVHGLEGSGEAGYMQSLSAAALAAGFAAHRFHMRTCGGTESYAGTLYHAGLTSDLLAVLRRFRAEGRRPAFLAGFSLGGNVVLKLAGELGESAAGLIAGVCGISTPLDLAACADRLGHLENRIYQVRFVRRMRARLLATGRYSKRDLVGLDSVMAIDDRITAPSFGFGNAANYYRTQSALSYLERIRIPTLLIQAQDDPLVPFPLFESAAVRGHAHIELFAPECGGHLGFLGRRPHRFWSDDAIIDWIRRHVAG
jgi:predicted alpha/beta-fold hydrolase